MSNSENEEAINWDDFEETDEILERLVAVGRV